MNIKGEAKVPAFARSRFVFIQVLRRHFIRNKIQVLKSLNRRKFKTRNIKENTYPVKTELLQNNLGYKIKEIIKNTPPTIRKCRDIDENVCIIYRKLPGQHGQRESRAKKLSRDDNLRLRPTINVHFC